MQHSPVASYGHCHQVSSLSIASQCTLYRSLLCCGPGTADIFSSCQKLQAASHNITTATASMELVMSVNGLQLNISSLAISNYAMQCGYQSYCVNSGKPQAFI